MNKEQATALASEGKKKATAFWTAFKEKIVTLWKSGRKGKAICIGGAVLLLLLLTRCGGSDSGGSNDTGRGGEYTGWDFSKVFMGAQADEGKIYKFESNISIKVLQAMKKGNLVGYMQGANPFAGRLESLFKSFGGSLNRIVWVETPGKRYEDGETLGEGFYIRRGSYEYKGTDGGEHTVARYVEVTDEATLKTIQKQIKDEEAAEAQAKLEAEGQPFEVNAPIKSLCGFAIGATPSSVKSLLINPSEGNSLVDGKYTVDGKMVTPFRHFDFAELKFSPAPILGGMHLTSIHLKASDGVPQELGGNVYGEIKTIAAMLEKKFGIKLIEDAGPSILNYYWGSRSEDGNVKQSIMLSAGSFGLSFWSDFFSPNEEKAMKEKLKPAKLSADAGADQL